MSSQVNQSVYRELESVVGSERITDEPVALDAYSLDVWCPGMMYVDRGQSLKHPSCIVFPETTKEVSEVIRIAGNHLIPVVPRGGGAGDSGGAVPLCGGIVLDMKRMDAVKEIDEMSLAVTCQTGLLQVDLEDRLNEQGFTLNHLPASHYCSTVGGFLSTRGSGVLSSKYGKIENIVMSLEIVLPNGEVAQTPPVPQHSAGPDFNRLFIGAEGTLGVITEVTLQMYHLPRERRFRGYLFKDLHTALEAGRRIMTKGLDPCVIRTYDKDDTRVMVKNVLGIEREDIGGYMIMGFDGQFEDIVELQERQAMQICNELGGEDLGREPGETWWNHRYDFYYPPHTLESKHYLYGVIDTIATYRDIERVYTAMREVLYDKFSSYNFHFGGHFSHWYEWGTAFYPNFIVREPPDDPSQALQLYNDIFETGIRAAIANGGVLNEHHGVGLKLGRLMKEQYKEGFQIFQAIKKALDPKDIMNPGKMGLDTRR